MVKVVVVVVAVDVVMIVLVVRVFMLVECMDWGMLLLLGAGRGT